MRNTYDAAIIGAGPAGLCFAGALSRLGLSVALVEKQSCANLERPAADGRDIALTYFSRKMLEMLGVWEHIPSDAVSFIREARVYNGEFPRYMTLSSGQTDQLAFIVANHHIRAAAYAAVKNDPKITLLDAVSLNHLELKNQEAELRLSDGTTLFSKLAVAADSRFSETRRKAGISASLHDFSKTMIVCQMEHQLGHEGVAHECFNQGHTLAVLPLGGNRSSVIITLPPSAADAMLALPVFTFYAWVTKRFNRRLGMMRLDSERFAYPLVGVYANRFMAKRFALVGDAAVGMHPVTAHGFNFGLKSAHTLSECIQTALQTGSDIASTPVLARYEHIHTRTTKPLYLATSAIVGLYTTDTAPAKIARKFLLQAADRMWPVKATLMAKLMETHSSRRGLSIPSPLQVARSLLHRAA